MLGSSGVLGSRFRAKPAKRGKSFCDKWAKLLYLSTDNPSSWNEWIGTFGLDVVRLRVNPAQRGVL